MPPWRLPMLAPRLVFALLALCVLATFLATSVVAEEAEGALATGAPGEEGASPAAEGEGSTTEEPHKLDTQTQLLLAVVLIILSAIFAGLTLGIMAVDTLSLEIIASAGSEPDRTHAQTILPVRRKGHQTLCTLVLGNMWANVMIAQFCADVNPEGGGEGEGESGGSGAIIGFLLSTFIILIFTEVLPMSICKSKDALAIAARGVPILKVFMVLLFPIAWPLGKMLDKMLHHDPGQVYDRAELKKLMMLHAQGDLAKKSGLGRDDAHGEVNLIMGALEFREATAGKIMTPIRDVIMLEQHRVVDAAVLEDLWRCGHSRVPVYTREVSAKPSASGSPIKPDRSGDDEAAGSPDASAHQQQPRDLFDRHSTAAPDDEREMSSRMLTNNSLVLGHGLAADASVPSIQVVGLLHVKDLITLDPTRGITAADLLETYPHGAVQYVAEEEHLDATLRELQNNAAHLSVVRDGGGGVIGIVTLEDLVEKMIKSEIFDEFDDDDGDDQVASANHSGDGPRVSLKIGFHGFNPTAADAHPTSGRLELTPAQVRACATYLVASVDLFAFWQPSRVEMLVRAGAVFVPGPVGLSNQPADDDAAMPAGDHLQAAAAAARRNGVTLYSAGVNSSRFVLVVSGAVAITAGAEHFTSERRSWTWLGAEALDAKAKQFTPRFTATVVRDSCIIIVDAASYNSVRGGGSPQHVVAPKPDDDAPTAPAAAAAAAASDLRLQKPPVQPAPRPQVESPVNPLTQTSLSPASDGSAS